MFDRSARGAKPLEVIGTYNPIPKKPTNLYDDNAHTRPYKEIALDRARAKYWLGVGAQPSDPVWKLMGMVSLNASCGGAFLGEMCWRVWFPGGSHTALHFFNWGSLRWSDNLLDGFANITFICRLVLSSRSLLPSTRHNGMPTVSPSGRFSLTTATDLSIMDTP
jgi:ribosomal protein S16